jgi:hypothetical protein
MDDSKKGTPRIADAVWEDLAKTREMVARHPPISKEVFDKTLDECVRKEQSRASREEYLKGLGLSDAFIIDLIEVGPIKVGSPPSPEVVRDIVKRTAYIWVAHRKREEEQRALARKRFLSRVKEPFVLLGTILLFITLALR